MRRGPPRQTSVLWSFYPLLVWLGDTPQLEYMSSLGLQTRVSGGWENLPIPKNVKLNVTHGGSVIQRREGAEVKTVLTNIGQLTFVLHSSPPA